MIRHEAGGATPSLFLVEWSAYHKSTALVTTRNHCGAASVRAAVTRAGSCRSPDQLVGGQHLARAQCRSQMLAVAHRAGLLNVSVPDAARVTDSRGHEQALATASSLPSRCHPNRL